MSCRKFVPGDTWTWHATETRWPVSLQPPATSQFTLKKNLEQTSAKRKAVCLLNTHTYSNGRVPPFRRPREKSLHPFHTFAFKVYIAVNCQVVLATFRKVIFRGMLRNGWDLKRDVYGIQIAVTRHARI